MFTLTTKEKMELIEKYKGHSLKDLRPDLVSEWHPTKNGDLTSEMVGVGSVKKVWWFLPYDDPQTGRHFDFEWEARISNRAYGKKCPYLTGRAVWVGFNDLATTHPDVAKTWHPTKNGDLTPEMVAAGSIKVVWWLSSEFDPQTGKPTAIEWEECILTRAPKRRNRPPRERSARVSISTELLKEWHPTKNGDLTPKMVASHSEKKVWWYLPYDDPQTGKHFDFEWEAKVCNRTNGAQCPFLTGYAVFAGFNDLATACPQIAAQWHPTKNGDLTPEMVTPSSMKKVWWYLPYDDPQTGKHFDFEWESTILNRTRKNTKCPFLVHNVWRGFNDLATVNPELAKEWHPTKNGDLTPEMVTPGSMKKVWWYLPYDDPATGKHFDFEWEAMVKTRASGIGCPFLSGRYVWQGFNDLATLQPNVAKEWHTTKNRKLKARHFTCGSPQKVWWQCERGHEWQASISSRSAGACCPRCGASRGERKVIEFFYKHGVHSKMQYTFEDCVYQKRLRFDCAVLDKDGSIALLVEYDGEQHFKPVDFTGRGNAEVAFKRSSICDSIKNQYCRENKIPLVRIPYWDYDNIEQILLRKAVRYGIIN